MQTNPLLNNPRLVMLKSQHQQLTEWLNGHPAGHERAAIALLQRLHRPTPGLPESPRYLVKNVVLMTDDWLIDSSTTHVDFKKEGFQKIYHQCETEGLVLSFIHNHPSGANWFSRKDDSNEINLVTSLSGVNGPHSELVALLLCDGQWYGRLRSGNHPGEAVEFRHINFLGKHLDICLRHVDKGGGSAVLARQESAFGKPFNEKMRSLRFCVIGASGTGSPVATLLARAGAGEIIIIDGDRLEGTNLNRVRGFRHSDIGRYKAEVLAEFINSLEIGCIATPVCSYLKESDALDAMSSADVILGCTDNESSRDLLNHAVYYHLQAFIDSGLGGNIQIDDNGEPFLYLHSGRVNILMPEAGRCLYCHGVITEEQVRFEYEVARNPKLLKLSKEELWDKHYLKNNGGEQAPGVGPFTSATADMALAGLFDLIKPYRKLPGDVLWDCIRQDFIGMSIYSNHPLERPDCPFCQKPIFLLKNENGYRLGMPALGKYNVDN